MTILFLNPILLAIFLKMTNLKWDAYLIFLFKAQFLNYGNNMTIAEKSRKLVRVKKKKN